MKSQNNVGRFDYSKYESNPSWDSDSLKEYEFWGVHPKSGRIHIDTKRYAKACEMIGIKDFMPEGMFANRSTPYFIPAKQHKYDYVINIFNDLLNDFQRDWEMEYKPIFKMIKTTKEVYENTKKLFGSRSDSKCKNVIKFFKHNMVLHEKKRNSFE